MRLMKPFSQLLVAALLISILRPVIEVTASPRAQSNPIPLSQAVANGQLFITGQPVAKGFTEPMVELKLTSTSGGSLQIMVENGTLLNPADPAFSPLVIADSAQVEVAPATTIKLTAFSVNHHLRFPDAMHQTDYGFAGTADASLVGLLEKIQANGWDQTYGAQLAVWVTAEGLSIQQLTGDMNTPPSAKDVDLANCILGGCQVESTAGAQASPVQPGNATPVLPDAANGKSGSSTGLIIGIAIVVVLGGAAAFQFLRQRQKLQAGNIATNKNGQTPGQVPQEPRETPVKGSDWGLGGTENLANPLPENPLPPQPKPNPAPVPAPAAARRARLTAFTGPFTGKVFSCDLPFILSRNELQIVVVREGTISGPHALLDLSDEPARIKDLHSINGVVVNGVRCQRGWVELTAGENPVLGRAEIRISGNTFEVLTGSAAGSQYGPYENPVVLSKDLLNVLAIGDADRQISDAHVMFADSGNEVLIRDLFSKAGTLVNGSEPERDQALNPGDRIRLGASEFIFQPE